MTATPPATPPPALDEIRNEFLDLDPQDRLQLLLEFANELPELPARYADDPASTERVAECQAPVYIALDVDDDGVHLHATAPREAPTTRGFASILVQGMAGASPESVLAIPADFPLTLGLTDLVSPLRLGGMSGMLARAQRLTAQKAS